MEKIVCVCLYRSLCMCVCVYLTMCVCLFLSVCLYVYLVYVGFITMNDREVLRVILIDGKGMRQGQALYEASSN